MRWARESLISTGAVCTDGGWISFPPREKGAKEYVVLGGGGLGVLVRAGLVRPPSLVSSAVEARLALLINDRRRDKVVVTCRGCSRLVATRSGLLRA